MAATREQGTSLTVLMAGFTALPAGVCLKANHPALGILIALAGAVSMVYSLVQMIRLRPLEFLEDKGGKE